MKWYHKPAWVIVAILAAGPFALPLVWLSPAIKKWQKILLTIAVIAVTVWLVKATSDIYRDLVKRLNELQSAMQ